jgi:hypothetical protein
MALPILAIAGAAQIVGNLIKGNNAADDAKKLRAQRKAFKTSDEIYDIEAATAANAQQGYDANTLNYLDNQINRAASSAYGTAERLGADPNQLAEIFDQQIQATMKVGAENHALNMENFGKYLGAKELLSKNLDAEWASQQGLIKDDLQAANERRKEATAGVSNGVNNIISQYTSDQLAKLYKEQNQNNTSSTASLPAIDPYNPTVINSSDIPVSQGVNLSNAIKSISSIVTPTNNNSSTSTSFNPATQKIGLIIGYDRNGQPIYGR